MIFKIGIGVMIRKSGNILLGKRIGSHGADTWSFPGGHLESHELPEATARREVLEETGLEIAHVLPLGFTVDHFEEINTDFLTLFYAADWVTGVPQLLEKDKCSEWRWFSTENLPKPLFKPICTFLAQQPNAFLKLP